MGKRKKSKGKKGQKSQPAQCYLCGLLAEEPTIDHVPAWCLAPDAPQSQFIQLPACKQCNNFYQLQESRFRDYVANVAVEHASAAAAYQKFQRRIQREEERLGRPNRDLQRILDNSTEAFHYTVDGQFLGISRHIRPALDFFINETCIKIARGIHYYHTKKVLPPGHHIYIYPLHQFQFVEYVHAAPGLSYGKHGDFFEYSGGYEQNNPLCGVWAISIYGKVGAAVSFETEKRSNWILRSLLDIQHPGPHFYEAVT